MKEYLTLILLLIPLWCYGATGDVETVIGKTDTAVTTILGKAGTGIASVLGKNYTDGDSVSCDSCSGNRSLMAHFENNDDVTVGTPCGCSDGDTTVALTNATYGSTYYQDGAYSLHIGGSGHYATWSNTSRAILDEAAGTIKFWIRVSTWLSNGRIFYSAYNTSTDYLRIRMVGTSNTDIEFDITYNDGTSTLTATTAALNGGLNTWYYLVGKYTQSDVDPNLGIYVYSDEGSTLLSSGTSNTNLAAWGGGPASVDLGSPGEAVYDIDKFEISKAWE